MHAKANELDRLLEQDRGTAKADVLALAPSVESAKDLSRREASILLDHLEARIAEAKRLTATTA